MKSIALRLVRLEDRLAPAVATWGGGGADNKWTTAANWAGDVAPQADDDLAFPLGAAQLSNVNDFAPGTAFHSLKITALNYHLTGNAVALAGGIDVQVPITGDTPAVPEIGLPLTLTADQTFANTPGGYNVTGPVNLNGHALTLSAGGLAIVTGAVTGAGSLTVAGEGPVRLTATNTFTGPTTVSQGTLDVRGSLPGPVTVQSSGGAAGTLAGSGSVGDVTVAGGLAPGNAFEFPPTPNTLKTGNLSLGATAAAEFRIVPPGVANGVAVTGTVRVGGTLGVITPAGYQAQSSQRYTLISNDGTDPIVGTFANAPEGGLVTIFSAAFRITYTGGDGNDLVATAVPNPAYAVGAGAGGGPQVNVYSASGELVRSFLAYAPTFRGGVRVATADVTGDGVPDVITAPGPGGGPHVKVFDGRTFAVVREWMAYDPAFTGGVSVATGRINVDNTPDIITGAGAGGGPHVKVFDGATGAVLSSFMAYDPRFTGGVSVAGTDYYANIHGPSGPGSVVTGPGPGGGPDVRVFDGTTGALTREFLAYDPAFTGGVNVAARGPVYINFGALIPTPPTPVGSYVTAPASAGGPDVRLFDAEGKLLGGFQAYAPSFFGGVTVGVETYSGTTSWVVTGAGPGGGPHVKLWQVDNNATSPVATQQQSFLAFDPGFFGGVFVG